MSIVPNPSILISKPYEEAKIDAFQKKEKLVWPMTIQDLLDEAEDHFGEIPLSQVYVYVHENKGSKKSGPTGIYIQRR